jgi:hypothetical protein
MSDVVKTAVHFLKWCERARMNMFQCSEDLWARFTAENEEFKETSVEKGKQVVIFVKWHLRHGDGLSEASLEKFEREGASNFAKMRTDAALETAKAALEAAKEAAIASDVASKAAAKRKRPSGQDDIDVYTDELRGLLVRINQGLNGCDTDKRWNKLKTISEIMDCFVKDEKDYLAEEVLEETGREPDFDF